MKGTAVNIPSLPIDFASMASQGVLVLGSIAGAVACVIVLASLILMGFHWVSAAFTDGGVVDVPVEVIDNVEVETVDDVPVEFV